MKTANSFLSDPVPMYAANCADGCLFFDDTDMVLKCREWGLPLYISYDHHQETVVMLLQCQNDYDKLRVKYENLLAMIVGSGTSSDDANIKIKEYLSEIKE